MKAIERQIVWLTEEAELFDMQGLSVDAEHGFQLFAIRDTMQALLDVARPAKRMHECRADDEDYFECYDELGSALNKLHEVCGDD